MVAIRCADVRVELREQESVLDGLIRGGVPVPWSCRAGLCQTCMLRAVAGTPPAAAQQGLKDSLEMQNYFLACVCYPAMDLELALPGQAERAVPAVVRAQTPLAPDIVELVLEPATPLYGILRDALSQGHDGPIRLFHGSRDLSGLYLIDEWRALAEAHPQLGYRPCLSGPEVPAGFAAGRAQDVALGEVTDLRGWRLFLCGHPDMVGQAKKRAFLAGASLPQIHADAFHRGSLAARAQGLPP